MSTLKYEGLDDLSNVIFFFLKYDEHLIDNPVFADIANVHALHISLFKSLHEVRQENDLHDVLNHKKLIYDQLVHYGDSIASVQELQEDYNAIAFHRIYIGAELKILSWIYEAMYGGEPDLSNREGSSPQGFLRYLKMNCKPEVTAHFLGLALQQFVRSHYPDEALYQNEGIFSASYNFVVELVLEKEESQQLADTIEGQKSELLRLRDELFASEAKLEKTPDNEAVQAEQQKQIIDFMTERLEMEFLSKVVLRLF